MPVNDLRNPIRPADYSESASYYPNELSYDKTNKKLHIKDVDGVDTVLNDIDTTLTKSNAAADSKAVGDALNQKVDQVPGKGLSTNDFTTEEKTKLAKIIEVSEITVDSALSPTSTNPVQNKVIKAALDEKANASTLNSHTGDKNNPHGVTAEQVGGLPVVDITNRVVDNNLEPVFDEELSKMQSGTYKALIYGGLPSYICKINDTAAKAAVIRGDNHLLYRKSNNAWTQITCSIPESGAVDAIKRNVDNHIANSNNPHKVTASQIGAAPTSHTHDEYMPKTGGYFSNNVGISTKDPTLNLQNELGDKIGIHYYTYDNSSIFGIWDYKGNKDLLSIDQKTGIMNMRGKRIWNVGTPTESIDAANKGYVDSKCGTYITSAGKSANWYYRTWSNGFKECWTRVGYNGVTVGSAWGNLYESSKVFGDFALPFTYSQPATVVEVASLYVSTGSVMLQQVAQPVANIPNRSKKYYAVRPDAFLSDKPGDATLSVYVSGF